MRGNGQSRKSVDASVEDDLLTEDGGIDGESGIDGDDDDLAGEEPGDDTTGEDGDDAAGGHRGPPAHVLENHPIWSQLDVTPGSQEGGLGQQVSAVAGLKAYGLYQAAFDRVPDHAGLGYWIQQMKSGAEAEELAQAFVASEEFQERYGDNLDAGGLVQAFYNNVLGRDPDAEGYAYWVELAEDGMTAADMLLAFAGSPENEEQVVETLQSDQYLIF